jgi:hypothetical protein
MTDRDEFAKAALQGLLAGNSGKTNEWAVEQAYVVADMMVEASINADKAARSSAAFRSRHK